MFDRVGALLDELRGHAIPELGPGHGHVEIEGPQIGHSLIQRPGFEHFRQQQAGEILHLFKLS